MATPIRSVANTEDAESGVPGGLHMVARQPILDQRGRVHAYKLRFRGGTNRDESAAQAWLSMAKTAAHFGLHKPNALKNLTGKMPAFVCCPPEALQDQLAQTLAATLTVLEIPGSLEMPPELAAVCQELKTMGFRFALDDFKWQPEFKPLLEMADFVKVDIDRTTKEERRDLFEQLRGKPIAMLAKNINTQASYVRAREEGFELFEGYYFCEPVQVRNRRPPVNQMLRIDILRALQRTPLEVHKVGQLVKRDGPLTFQLLRLANSPNWAIRKEIDSIEQALMIVGDDVFRRIATTAIASEFNGNQSPELLCMAMVRGRFCEVACAQRNLDPFIQYLLGLLSLLPAMQGQLMETIAPTLPLGDEIREALLGTKNPERVLLGWLEQFECGDWAGCDAAAECDGLDQRELAKIYVDAAAWTEGVLYSAT
jgi:EAL and modified HD-GYP domain-containing signal transduction protein